MALTTNFNFNPYYDDYNEDKKFLKILFKPGYSVQARELTQLQSILQKQIERFGNNIFFNGVAVLDGQSAQQICTYFKIQDNYEGVPIDISDFAGKTIYSLDQELSKRAEVIVASPADTALGDPPTLLIIQMYGDPFTVGESFRTDDDTPIFGTIRSTADSIGQGQAFTTQSGVYYYNGYFIKTDTQSIAISKYNTNSATLKVGFEINEYFVTANDDASLVDPAQEASNYQAPGADRYKIELTLATRALDSTDLENFLELAQFDNGNYRTSKKTTIYNKITDELARRTYDESGDYVVRPFSIASEANTANSQVFNAILGPGKAYIQGYEVALNYPSTLVIDKARDTTTVSDYRINANYGNFFYTNNVANTFNINQLVDVDLHCVYRGSINTLTTATYSNTKIGTAKVKSTEYVSSANNLSGNTYIFAVELMDVQTSNLTGTLASGGADWVQLPSGASNANNAYTGAFLRITSGPGSIEGAKLITNYNGVTKIANVSSSYVDTPTSASLYTIEFNVQDVESIVSVSSGSTINVAMDISQSIGINPSTLGTTNKAILFDSKVEELIFNIGTTYTKPNSVSDINFSYVRRFITTLTAGVSSAVTVEAGDTFGTATTELDKLQNYTLICRSPGTSSFAKGQVIPVGLWSVVVTGGTSAVFTVTGGNDAVIEILATITVSNSGIKGKTLVESDTSYVADPAIDTFTSDSPFANVIKLYDTLGQLHIDANTVIEVPGERQSLFVCDVLSIKAVIDFEGNEITQANLETATDVTDRYTLDNGQRDSYYDYASITLKPGATPPIGPIVIYFDRFTHPENSYGFFCVNSYSESLYERIPSYLSASGKYYELRDCLDFRPSFIEKTFDSSLKALNIDTTIGPKIPKRNTAIVLSYQNYLNRVDKLVLSSQGSLSLIKGVSSSSAIPPANRPGSMPLYEIRIPAYTLDLKEIQFKKFETRRYTMKDIGVIDQRLKNIEYYSTLSLLENDAASKSDTSLYGRTKNGILTDSFVGFDVVDTTSSDFNAAIDSEEHELRCSANINSYGLNVDETSSTNYRKGISEQTTTLFFLTGPEGIDDTVLVQANNASSSISVNPYNVQLFSGDIRLKPQSDIWVDINRLPSVTIEDPANAGMIELINDTQKWAEIQWGSWKTTSIGRRRVSTWTQTVSLGGRWFRNDTWARDQISTNQTRTGTKTYFVPERVDQSLGDTLLDSRVIPWMRKIKVIYNGRGLKPGSIAYPFFDEESVSQYVSRHNYFTIDSSFSKIFRSKVAYQASGGTGEFWPFTVYQRKVLFPGGAYIKNGSTIIGNATITMISGNRIFVDNVSINGTQTVNWNSGTIFLERPPGAETGEAAGQNPVYANVRLATSDAYTYTSGRANVTSETLSTSIQLGRDAANASITFDFGNTPIRTVLESPEETNPITRPRAPAIEWDEKESIITAYDSTTRTLTVSPALRVEPNSIIQIGEVKADSLGNLSGSFFIPRGKFRTGEKNFRLTDNREGKLGDATSRAESAFFAEGRLNTVEERILSTIVPKRVVEIFTENRTLITYENQRIAQGSPWKRDPVAETFLVDPDEHPDGVFLSRARVCFSNKDEVLPIRLQIRPSVNGYPSATDIYPFADISLDPDEVQTSDYPDLDDPLKYTEFVFQAPIHLAPGEHAIVLLSNSNKYEVFIAEMGSEDLNLRQNITAQPFTGSFFKSQNGQTWTAEQNADLMFRIYNYQFATDKTASIVLDLDPDQLPTDNVDYDMMILQTQEIEFANCSLTYSFNSELRNTGGTTGFQQIPTGEEILMLDSFGERVINPESGPLTLSVRAQMTTKNKDVSPIIDLERFGVLTIGQKINNLELSNDNIYMANTGSYSNGSNITVTITGDYGNGAIAVANVVKTATTNTIDKIVLTNVGSGYKTSPTITISGGNGSPPAAGKYAASAVFNGEDKKRGGNSS